MYARRWGGGVFPRPCASNLQLAKMEKSRVRIVRRAKERLCASVETGNPKKIELCMVRFAIEIMKCASVDSETMGDSVSKEIKAISDQMNALVTHIVSERMVRSMQLLLEIAGIDPEDPDTYQYVRFEGEVEDEDASSSSKPSPPPPPPTRGGGGGGSSSVSSSSSPDRRPYVQSEIDDAVRKIRGDILGMDEILDRIDASLNPLYKQGVDWKASPISQEPVGIELCGAPGTGKGQFINLIACYAGDESRVHKIMGSSLSEFVSLAEKKLKSMVEHAFELGPSCPSVIVLDEADMLFSKKGGEGSQKGGSTMQGDFQQLGTWLVTKKAHWVTLVCATNHPEVIPNAVRTRFPDQFFIPLPEPTLIAKFMKMEVQRNAVLAGISLQQIDEFVASRGTVGYALREIHDAMKATGRGVARKRSLQKMDARATIADMLPFLPLVPAGPEIEASIREFLKLRPRVFLPVPGH